MPAKKKSILYCKYSTERLMDLVYCGKMDEIFKALSQTGVNIDVRDSKGNTPLLLACLFEVEDIAELLINFGANVNVCNSEKCTVLHFASRNGWTNIVRFLVTKVCDLNARDIRSETVIHHAISSGKVELVKVLVEEGADINSKNLTGFTPLLYAAQHSHGDIFDLLLAYGANFVGNEGLLLYYACQNNWSCVVEFFVKRVRDINKRDVISKIASHTMDLDTTSSLVHLEIVNCLVEEGTDIKISKIICQAALYEASMDGDLEVVKWLLKKGPDVSAKYPYYKTPLHMASKEGSLEVVKCLVEAGTNINLRDDCGETAVHLATCWGHLAIVKYLVEKGAYINVKNFMGTTPLLFATSFKYKDIVDLLIYSGANVVDCNFMKNTTLHYAAQYGWLDTLQFLVERGCNMDARNTRGETALSFACETKEFYAVKYLLQAGAKWDTVDINGSSPLNQLTLGNLSAFKLFQLFIEHGAYLKPVEYNAIVKSSSLKVLQNVKLCCQIFANKFNNYDLPELYKVAVSGSLPCIEKMKIANGGEVSKAIERTVEFEIQTKGYCNICDMRPMALSLISVKSVLEYFKNKKQETKNRMKRKAAFDSENVLYQHSRISMCQSNSFLIFD